MERIYIGHVIISGKFKNLKIKKQCSEKTFYVYDHAYWFRGLLKRLE